MGTTARHQVIAHNTATASSNKIHDDVVARRYGFGGGLVPGVDVYAYMTWAAADRWGLDWLAAGTMRARFLSPVYEGRSVVVVAGDEAPSPTGPTMTIELHGEDGAICATGTAGLPGGGPRGAGDPPPLGTWPVVPQAERRPEASPESLAPGTALAVIPRPFLASDAGAYLDDVRENLTVYRDPPVAHPGWLLRDANRVLGSNVALGPWIHVESDVRHHSVVRAGETVEARATVVREWAHKGHRFVELDVGIVAAGDRVAARVTHTAIYRPREPAPG